MQRIETVDLTVRQLPEADVRRGFRQDNGSFPFNARFQGKTRAPPQRLATA